MWFLIVHNSFSSWTLMPTKRAVEQILDSRGRGRVVDATDPRDSGPPRSLSLSLFFFLKRCNSLQSSAEVVSAPPAPDVRLLQNLNHHKDNKTQSDFAGGDFQSWHPCILQKIKVNFSFSDPLSRGWITGARCALCFYRLVWSSALTYFDPSGLFSTTTATQGE